MSVVQYPGRPGLDNSKTTRIQYTVNSYFPSRKPRPRSMRGNKILNKDIKETMRHATLINIVAAVNEDVHCRPLPRHGSGSTTSSLRSTVSVISNFKIPHEKSVSIPQSKQRIFNMPDEIVQRKPVYYKHSGDLEVSLQPHLRLLTENDSYNSKMKKKETVQQTKSSAREIIKGLPKKPQIMNINLSNTIRNQKSDNKHKVMHESRVTSGVRQLGTIKKTERRQLHDLRKCDAVDFFETQGDRDVETPILDDSNKVLPPYTSSRIPYIRTKSLPVIFPTKTVNKLSPNVSASHRHTAIYRDRPLSQSLRKQTPDSMLKRINDMPSGFRFGELSINNGVNQAPTISGILVHDSEKQPNLRASPSGNSKQKSNKIIKFPDYPTDGRGSSGVFITLKNEFPVHLSLSSKMKAIKNKTDALHEAVLKAMNGRTARNETEVSKTDNRSLASAKSKKSCLTSRSGFSDNFSENRMPKKVQFLSSDSSLNSSETNSSKEDNMQATTFRGDSGIIRSQTPTQTLRTFSPSIQPMTVRELLRLEQKILPANTQPPPPDILANYFTTSSLINVQTLHKGTSDISSKMNTSSVDADSNIDEREDQQDLNNLNGCSNSDNLANESKKETTEDNNISNGVDNREDYKYAQDADDSDKAGFYKLIKAVDRQPYDGFEHKKVRRSSISSKSKDQEKDQCKAKYVKVRLS